MNCIVFYVSISTFYCLSVSSNNIANQNNAIVTLKFKCFENVCPERECEDRGYSNCENVLKLCVSENKTFKTMDSYKCKYFEKEYNLKLNFYCLKGDYNSLEDLYHIISFEADITNIKVNILMYRKTEEQTFKPMDQLSHVINKAGHFELENPNKFSEVCYKIRMKSSIHCLPGFSGENCQNYCLSEKNHNHCLLPNETCFNINRANCNSEHIKDHLQYCQCLNRIQNDTCSENYINCLNEMLTCTNCCNDLNKKNNCNESGSLGKIVKESSHSLISVSLSTVYLVLGGFLIIIFILLLSVMLMWNRKQKKPIIYNSTIEREHIPLQNLQRNLPQIPNEDRYSNIDDYLHMKIDNEQIYSDPFPICN